MEGFLPGKVSQCVAHCSMPNFESMRKLQAPSVPGAVATHLILARTLLRVRSPVRQESGTGVAGPQITTVVIGNLPTSATCTRNTKNLSPKQ
jgi:hypothetical protein